MRLTKITGRQPSTGVRERHIAITGASSGIGASLAEAFAAPGVRLCLSGRDGDRLEITAMACRRLGASVQTDVVDVTDRDAIRDWLAAADKKSPIDLVIANAGRTSGPQPGEILEDSQALRSLFDVNFHGVVDTAAAVLPMMRERRSGHIAIMCSLASFCPIPGAAGYAASKAALKSWADALRVRLADENVAVSVIIPGYVDTPMSRQLSGSQPLRVSARRAARRIRDGLDRRRPVIAFPAPMALGARLLPLVPAWIADRVIRQVDYTVEPNPEPGSALHLPRRSAAGVGRNRRIA